MISKTLAPFAAAICFSVCPADVSHAQTAKERERVVNAIRGNGCSATEEEMNRIFPSLGMTKNNVISVIQQLRETDDMIVDDTSGYLSKALCRGAEDTSRADTKLATRLVKSERAQRDHIEMLFAESECKLSYTQYQNYLERKFPTSAAKDSTSDVGRTRTSMEALPALMIRDGILYHRGNKKVLHSRGDRCD